MLWQKSLALVLDSTSKAWGGGGYLLGSGGASCIPMAVPLTRQAPSRPRHPPSEGASPERGTALKEKAYKPLGLK